MNRHALVLCLSSVLANFVPDAAARLKGEGIIGGDVAEKGRFPYQVSVQVFGQNYCGGSIIDERHVVAAAHCVYTSQGKFVAVPMKIVAGVDSLASSADRIVANVAEVFIPTEYNSSVRPYYSATGDIAVLKLDRDLDLENHSNIGKVELPKAERNYEDAEAVVTGFGFNKIQVFKNPETGKFDENGSSDGKLRFAKAIVLANDDCQKQYKGPIYEKHLCARVVQRDLKAYEGICTGDSGGPLVYNNTLIGVANASPLGCREKRKPAIYARVAKFMNFIQRVINGKIDEDIRAGSLPVFG